MYIDSHAHLESDVFDNDIENVVKRAYDNDVKKIINVGYNQKSIEKTLHLTDRFENIYAAVGMHPHDAKDYNISFEKNLLSWLKKNKVLALGEIGLDYFKEYSPAEIQREVFKKQLNIAKKIDIPVVIHCRDAYDHTYNILKEIGIEKGVMHCFSGKVKDVERFTELGLYISFTGTVTFRKSDKKVVRAVPENRLLLETDCPYMTPVPYRGKRNEPAYIPDISRKIAEIRKTEEEKIKKIATENTLNLFEGLR